MSANLLNPKKIDELSKEIGTENVSLLFDIFLGEMDAYAENLRSVSGAEQLSYLTEISHALKSSAASFGADCLCELANAIDNKAKNNELNAHEGEVTRMVELLADTRDAYRSWHG